jgi:hypothetical protein
MASRQIPWTRVLVEGVVIVGSILLAFGIDTWWDRLGEKTEERESLLVVEANLQVAIEHLASYEDESERIVEASIGAYRALSSQVAEGARDSIADLLITSGVRTTMRLPRTGYVDLVSTGALRLIRDRQVRNGIVQFYDLADQLETVAEKNSTIYTDGILKDVLVGNGLLLRRPIRADDDDRSSSDAMIRDRLGAGFEHRPDPLWSFTPSSREWDRVRSALLQNGRGIQTAAALASRLHAEAVTLREAINSYLEEAAL